MIGVPGKQGGQGSLDMHAIGSQGKRNVVREVSSAELRLDRILGYREKGSPSKGWRELCGSDEETEASCNIKMV